MIDPDLLCLARKRLMKVELEAQVLAGETVAGVAREAGRVSKAHF